MPPDTPTTSRRPQATECALGTIVNTHGIRGELRMLPYNPDSDSLRPGQQITLRWVGRSLSVQVRAVRLHKRFRLLVLDGYESVTAAETLVGAEVCINLAQLPPLGAQEVYHHDLIGLRVETVDGRVLGVVDEVMTTGSNDVCVVRGPGGEHLIPLIADVVRELDLTAGRLVIEPLPGLLD